jgi:hypothetical protein
MSKKVSVVMLVVLLASLAVTPALASNPGKPPLPKPPLSWPGVPTKGPLTPEQIKKLAAPPQDTSALEEQFKAELAKGFKMRPLPTGKLEAGVALAESLTDEQRQAIGEAFSRREKALGALMAPIKAGLKAKEKAEAAVSLEAAQRLEGRLQAWQAALDSDIEKVLTEEQGAQYRASRPTVPKLGLGASLADTCTDGCHDYYAYYGYLYQYYAYVHAYYGYCYSGCSWAYHAYVYNYHGYYYSYYAYVYGYDTYYGYYAYLYSYYGYIYSYYAYWYCYDAYSTLYTSYYYAYWGYVYSWYAYCCANDC